MGGKPRLTPRKRPLQARSRFTVDQLLEAAAQVFSQRGYAGTTTNQVAERAGVSIGSLYQYFPNKDALLLALVERHMEQGAALLEALCADPAEATLEVLVAAFVHQVVGLHLADPGLHQVLLYEAPRTAAVTARLHRIEDAMATAVEARLARIPGASVAHTGHAGYLLVHLVESLAHEFVVHPPRGLDRAGFEAEICDMVCRYVRGRCTVPVTRSRSGDR